MWLLLTMTMLLCVADDPTPAPSPASTPAAASTDFTAHKTKGGILFQYGAPGAGMTVYLAGDFNNWANNTSSVITDPQFKMDGPDANGVFKMVVPMDPGAHKFKFVVNGAWIAPDWAKDHDTDGNAVIYVSGAGDVLLSNPLNSDWKPAQKDGKWTFQLYYPSAKNVYLAGDFNNWGNVKNDTVSDAGCAMHGPDANGLWQISIPLKPGSHSYKFAINGTAWEIDPNADKVDAQGNSVVDAGN